MAVTGWSGIASKIDTGDVVEQKLSTSFLNIDNKFISTDVKILANENAITALASRVTTLEVVTTPSVISLISTGKATQALVPGVAQKLDWMTSALVNVGTDISHTIATNDILINTTGIYRVSGVMSLTAPINDIIEIELYIDNLPTGLKASAIGRGVGSVVNFQNAFLTSFNINDDVHLYVKSTGTEITLSSGTMSIEKTEY